jgi:uncharacterized membrane protein YgdD (TMEM256/DUF423 family)
MSGTFWVRTGAILGFLAVAAGAFGAHYLKERLKLEPRMLETFETGVRYQMYHALAILAVGVLMSQGASGAALQVAGWAFLAGILLFSGGLYGLALGLGPRNVLGPITPFGGISFLVGWIALAAAALTKAPDGRVS